MKDEKEDKVKKKKLKDKKKPPKKTRTWKQLLWSFEPKIYQSQFLPANR